VKTIKVPKGKSFASQLARLNACGEARRWVGKKSLKTAWHQCNRGDWMLWLAASGGVDRRLVVLAACQCARQALRHVPEGETRPLRAIEMAESWTRGEASIEQVHAAANAAYAAANAANAAYAGYAANAAAYAAYAADAANAVYAADAAEYAADAAAYAAVNAAFDVSMLASADIVRSLIPAEVVAAALEEK